MNLTPRFTAGLALPSPRSRSRHPESSEPSSCYPFNLNRFPVQLPHLNFISEELLVVFKGIYQWLSDMRADVAVGRSWSPWGPCVNQGCNGSICSAVHCPIRELSPYKWHSPCSLTFAADLCSTSKRLMVRDGSFKTQLSK